MDSSAATEKLEITKWLINLEDKDTLKKVALIMDENKKPEYDPAYEAMLSSKEKVAYLQRVGITGEELKKSLFEYIDSLPWKE